MDWKNSTRAMKYLEELLECDLCHKIAVSPCSFEICDHLFCRSCCDPFTGKHCPVCKQPAFSSTFNKAHRISDVINQVQKLHESLFPPDDSRVKSDNMTSKALSEDTTSKAMGEDTMSEAISEVEKLENFNSSKLLVKLPVKQSPMISPRKLKKIKRRNAKGETALHVSVMKGAFEEVQQLLQLGADPNAKDHAGWTPLHEAAIKGFRHIAVLLLDNGANINIPGGSNNTPLHDAVANGHIQTVQLLVSRGANVNAKNTEGLTPIQYATDFKMKDAFKTPASLKAKGLTKKVPAKPDKELVLITTSLSEEQRKNVAKCAKVLNAVVATGGSENVTHLVTGCQNDGNCPRTLNYMKAIVSGQWIVQYKWIEECLKAEKFVEEFEYEVRGSRSHPGSLAPRKGRSNADYQHPPLFSGCNFYFAGDFCEPVPSKDHLIDLVEIGGGTVLRRMPTPVIVDSDLGMKANGPHHAKDDQHLRHCSYFILYQKQIPDSIKYDTPFLKSLPVSFLFNSIATFELNIRNAV